MAVKIRLQRKGRRKKPYYHIVVADSRSPRDGKFIERLGFYNPMSVPATIDLDGEKAFEWLMKGATPTETVRAILRFKGILYRKHLYRGVAKGALSQEEADRKWLAFKEEKEAKLRTRVQKSREDAQAQLRKMAGAEIPAASQAVEASSEEE